MWTRGIGFVVLLILALVQLGSACVFPPGKSVKATEFQNRSRLVPPTLLKLEALQGGNPLAAYAEMLELATEYRQSKEYAGFYEEVRYNLEEFLGIANAGVQAMSLPVYRQIKPDGEARIPPSYEPQRALEVIEREAEKTRIVIWGEEHHLSQTRSLYDALLQVLWRHGYRYLAAETFEDRVMNPEFRYPDYQSGFYLRDPIFASAVRTARNLGYKLIAYDTKKLGSKDDRSYRDRTQAENINARVFGQDLDAKVFVIAGRGHSSEKPTPDGWTPMASVLKQLTGIDPLTLYAPTMCERLTPAEEDPVYRFATSRQLVSEPTIFVNKTDGRLLGSEFNDAYIFWPRVQIVDGRPDWLEKVIGRRRVTISQGLRKEHGMRLLQAFYDGEPPSAIPADQILLENQVDKAVLLLPKGRFWIRSIDPEGNITTVRGVTVQ